MQLIKYCQHLAQLKDDIVFVGGVAMMIHGINHTPKDIDIVVNNLSGLDQKAKSYETTSKFSISGKRAFINKKHDVDIFIEKELPEFTIIEGMKVRTIESMINHNEKLYHQVDKYWQNRILERLAKLKLKQWQDKI